MAAGGAGRRAPRSAADGADDMEDATEESVAAEEEPIGIESALIPCKT